MNLASNSAKYKTAGEGHLFLHLEKGNNEAVLTVTDDGPGVPEMSLRHLFEAFYRTDKARSRTEDGSGLGMTIVQKSRTPHERHGNCRKRHTPWLMRRNKNTARGRK